MHTYLKCLLRFSSSDNTDGKDPDEKARVLDTLHFIARLDYLCKSVRILVCTICTDLDIPITIFCIYVFTTITSTRTTTYRKYYPLKPE